MISESINIIVWGLSVVFIVLYLVTLSGRLTIYLTNLIDPSKVSDPYTIDSVNRKNRGNNGNIQPTIIAAATATVEFITAGKGKISDIKKIQNFDYSKFK